VQSSSSGRTRLPVRLVGSLLYLKHSANHEISVTPVKLAIARGVIVETKEAIDQALADKKQVILFQNRRGYTPYKICGTCGFIPHCEIIGFMGFPPITRPKHPSIL
jgi:hypothetical protein